MKIISKFKDYYDYLISKYGEDPILIFDRRKQADESIIHHLPDPLPEWQETYGACATVSELYISNLCLYLFNTGQRVYTSYNIETRYLKKYSSRYSRCLMIRFCDGSEYALPQYYYYSMYSIPNYAPQENRKKHIGHITAYQTAPLVLAVSEDLMLKKTSNINSYMNKLYYANPQLSTLGIYVDADTVWQKIVEYLAQLKSEAEISPSVPDKDKIGNKGFDIKHSFRPKMKK